MADSSQRPILIVEDSDEDYEVMKRALRTLDIDHPVRRMLTGDDCLDFLQKVSEADKHGNNRPAIILLDLNLPGTDGREVLQWVKANENLKMIPVAVLTTSSNPKDIEACYRDGANSYIIKSMDFKKFTQSVKLLVQYWLDAASLP